MKNNRKKLIAYLTACSMSLSGCKMNFQDMFKKDKINSTSDDFSTSATSESTSEFKEPSIEIPNTSELESIPVTESSNYIQEETTAPTTEETKPSIEETESILESEPSTEIITEPTPEETVIEIPEELQTNEVIVYATTDVNIRSSNTTESLIIGCLKSNDSAYKIFSCDNNWDLVKYNDLIGFVYRDYLEYSNEIYENEYSHQKYNDIVLTTTELNFRNAPTTEANKISKFAKGTELQVIAKVDNGWLLVKYNGVIGYVHGDYTVSLLELAKLEYPELNLSEIDVQKVVYSTTDLNVRKGNSTDYEIIGGLERYESVRVLSEHDGWYFIMTNEYKFGFVSKSYTKDLDDIYVLVDLSEQRLYLYNNDELYYVTPVTTGKDSTPSDIGLFKIYNKATDVTLTDNKTYWSPVDYWMPYNGGEGLHDANWRNVFGTQNYKTVGSHGCINIPPEITDEIYETVSIGTKVLVHK